MPTPTILSYGMGVESTAILVRWIREPDTCPVPLEELLVLTAQTGDEYADTGTDVETHVLPLLRAAGIRFVQVARGGHREQDGLVVLDDSRAPTRVCLAGHYPLSEELRTSGIVPQYGSEHRCSLKFKAMPLTRFLDEARRETPDGTFWRPQDARRPESIEHLAFGFNITEPKRVARRRRYDSKTRIGIFPLVDWGWTRESCRTYLEKVLGVRWKKSCCVYCPFARVTEDLLARQRAHSAQMAEALLIEHLSLAMNPRGSLYRTCTLHTLTTRNEHTAALTAFAARLRETPWALYRVRRLYKAKGDAQRAVERLAVLPTEEQALDELHALARTEHLSLERIGRIPYVRFEHRQPEQYPTREGYYVIAPALIEPKPRVGLDRFDQAWTHTSQLCLIP